MIFIVIHRIIIKWPKNKELTTILVFRRSHFSSEISEIISRTQKNSSNTTKTLKTTCQTQHTQKTSIDEKYHSSTKNPSTKIRLQITKTTSSIETVDKNKRLLSKTHPSTTRCRCSRITRTILIFQSQHQLTNISNAYRIRNLIDHWTHPLRVCTNKHNNTTQTP